MKRVGEKKTSCDGLVRVPLLQGANCLVVVEFHRGRYPAPLPIVNPLRHTGLLINA